MFKVGDMVKLNGSRTYAYIRKNVAYEVNCVNLSSGSIGLFGVSGMYNANNFEKVGVQETNEMNKSNSLYIAVEIGLDNLSFEQVCLQVNASCRIHMAAFTSGEEAKNFVREEIKRDPNKKYVILHGNVLSYASTDVKFIGI